MWSLFNSGFYFRCVEVGDDDDDGDTVKIVKVLSCSKFVKTFYNFVLIKKLFLFLLESVASRD